MFRAVRGEGGRLIPLALAVLFALGNAAIGFIDDYCKLVRHQNEGLTERQKLLLQLVLTAAYLAMLRASGHLETSLRIPFTDMRLELSWFAYPVYLLVMVGFVNATNLTDGLDGLASSVCATVAAFTLLLAVWRRDADSTVLAAALLAGMLGFLVFNHHPAQMFMGDTGSLFLGGRHHGMRHDGRGASAVRAGGLRVRGRYADQSPATLVLQADARQAAVPHRAHPPQL